jgi:hypothetical protein
MSRWDAESDARYEWKTLLRVWEDARQVWRDVPALYFEREHWESFEGETLDFLEVLKEFMLVLDEVEEVARRRW